MGSRCLRFTLIHSIMLRMNFETPLSLDVPILFSLVTDYLSLEMGSRTVLPGSPIPV